MEKLPCVHPPKMPWSILELGHPHPRPAHSAVTGPVRPLPTSRRGKFRDAREKRMFGEKLAMEFWSLDHVWDYLEISLGLCWNYLEYFGITWTMWIIVWITWIILDGFSFNWSVLDYLDVWFHGFFLHLCSLLHSLGHFTAVHPGSGICVDPLHPPWFLGDIFLGGADGIFQ